MSSKTQPLLTCSGLSLSYGERKLFENLSLAVHPEDRIGIIGDNGVGKSSLLKLILAPENEAQSGTIAKRTGLQIRMLEQNPSFPAHATVEEVLESAFLKLKESIKLWEKALGEMDPKADEFYVEIEALGGFDYQHLMDAMRQELKLPAKDSSVETLSGGQKKRLALAKLLLEKPDLALFDEPTNHLDLDTIEWLEDHLANSRMTALIVTHDRSFLDRAVTIMAELRSPRRLAGQESERGALAVYPGGYTDYLEARELEEERRQALSQSKGQSLKSELDWARRQPKARTTKSRSRLQDLDELKSVVKALREGERRSSFGFGSPQKRLSNSVLSLEKVSIGYDFPLLKDFDLQLKPGERLGMMGPNGIGKTSLLKVMTGELLPQSGQRLLGPNTKISVFDQHRRFLDGTVSIWEALSPGQNDTVFPGGKPVTIQAWLARFAFPAGILNMPVSSLSGGERMRLALAKYLLNDANLMLFDEPTNDLDLHTLSVLEDALLGFSGTAIIVSHDRWFLNKMATRMLVFEALPPESPTEEAQITPFLQEGNWTDYETLRLPQVEALWALHEAELKAKEDKQKAAARKPEESARKQKQAEKEMARIEEEIGVLEEEVAKLQEKLSAPEVWEGDGQEGQALSLALKKAEERLETLFFEWDELAF